jgi:tetratricopeptide (TPR) repeat protein
MIPSAETAYLFRHALMREVAYGLQLPGDRARLHELAMQLIEQSLGGEPPGPVEDERGELTCRPLPVDTLAAELAEHARLALEADPSAKHAMARRCRLYLFRAAEHAVRKYQIDDAIRYRLAHAALADGTEQGDSLRVAGMLLNLAGRGRDAESSLRAAVDAMLACGNRRGLARAMLHLAGHLHNAGHRDEADRLQGEAQVIISELGNVPLQATLLGNQANQLRLTSYYAESEVVARQAIELYQQLGERRSVGVILGNLGITLRLMGRENEAVEVYRQALAIHREVGNRRFEGSTLGNFANMHSDAGRLEEAEIAYHEAWAVLREVGDRPQIGTLLSNLAGVYVRQSRLQEAVIAAEQAVAIHRDAANPRSEGVALGVLAWALVLSGDFEGAGRAFDTALALDRATRNLAFEGEHMCGRALLHLRMGRVDLAAPEWLAGYRISEKHAVPDVTRELHKLMLEACTNAGVPPFDEVAP